MRRIALAGIALCFGLAASSAMAQTMLRLAHHHAVDGAVDRTARHFADLVNEKTEGRVTIRVFPGAQLGQELEAFDLLNQGGLDMTVTAVSQMESVYPPVAVTSLPFIFRDWDHVREAFSGEFGERLRADLRDRSQVEILSYFGLGFRDMLFIGEPATTVEAMSGLRMRSPENFIWISMFESLGARPTPITWGEVYTAMQTGVADGLDSPAASAIDMKFNEVTKSLVRTRHMYSAMALNANKTAFQRLSSEDQELVREAAMETGAWADAEIAIPGEEAAYEKLAESGVAIHDVDDIAPWQQAVAPVWKIVTDRQDGSDQLIEMLVDGN